MLARYGVACYGSAAYSVPGMKAYSTGPLPYRHETFKRSVYLLIGRKQTATDMLQFHRPIAQDSIDCAGILRDRMLGSEQKAALRLFDLLDTLVAMRWDVGTSPKAQVAESALGSEKIAAVRLLLDHAITATKNIIGDTTRPLPPL